MSHADQHANELYFRLFNSLREAPSFLKELRSGNKTVQARDADLRLGNWFLEELKKIPNLKVSIRRRRLINTPETTIPMDHYKVCIDPIDGASHYYQRGHTAGLSHAACITVLKQKGAIRRFSDIVAGGIVELRTGDIWTATRKIVDGQKNKINFQVSVNNKPFNTIRQTLLNVKSMTIFASMHNAEDRERILRAFGNNCGMIRTHGSVASEIAYVASGQAIACISSGQSHYSHGAGFALVKGGGGVIVDFTGHNIENDIFDLKLKTPVIFAANMPIAEQILERINRP